MTERSESVQKVRICWQNYCGQVHLWITHAMEQVYVENAFTPIFSYQEHENNICETGGESTYVKYNQVCENEFFATTQKGMDALVGLKNEMIEKYNEK